MKVLTKPGVEIHLILDKKEAKWLKSLVQNPMLHSPSFNGCESYEDEEMRMLFWNACKKIEPNTYASREEKFEVDVPF
jgi:hypothetical protein